MLNEKTKYIPYIELLQKWQSLINLVSKSDINNIYERHILDSLTLSDYIKQEFKQKIKIIDIGSGAGFPGMILAIEQQNEFILIDSNHKKTSFLNKIKELYQLKNVKIINDRIENIKENTDIIISRAFKDLNETFQKCKNIIKQNTHLILLKGENVNIEIEKTKNYFNFQYKLINNIKSNGYIIHIQNVTKL